MPCNYASYPLDWKLRSRFVRFYRARNRCEWCGANNGQPHPVTGSKVVLTVAHVFDMTHSSFVVHSLGHGVSLARAAHAASMSRMLSL